MKFEVPQFIEIEDKIFGPLTWRQFVYLGGGCGAAVVLFLVLPPALALLIGLPLAALAGALSFYPINNRPFSYFLEAVYTYTTSSKLYLWRRDAEVVYREETKPASPAAVTPANRGTEHHSISSLTRSLELQALQKPDA